MRALTIPYEIIYVDDGSTDDTPRQIETLCEDSPCVKGIFSLAISGTSRLERAWRRLPVVRSSPWTATCKIAGTDPKLMAPGNRALKSSTPAGAAAAAASQAVAYRVFYRTSGA